jgi:hypothetical protein
MRCLRIDGCLSTWLGKESVPQGLKPSLWRIERAKAEALAYLEARTTD